MENKAEKLIEKFSASSVALIIANIIPVIGAIFFRWEVAPFMFLYWSENLVVGFYNVLKMAKAKGEIEPNKYRINDRPVTMADRRIMIKFFIIHYGLFTFGHGIFVLAVFGSGYKGIVTGFLIGLPMLFLSHAVSYWQNFLGIEEYKQISFAQLLWQPYKRIFVMHVTIIMGGTLAQSMGSPLYALLVMVGLKTAIDLISHWIEHLKFQVSTR